MERRILIDLDHTLFNTQEFRKFLPDGVDKINYKRFLYKDALPFVEYVKKYGMPVLFTEGDADFQNKKIKNLGLREVFGENIRVFPDFEKVYALKEGEELSGVVLVDDKPEILDKAISLGFKTIRVRRGKYEPLEGELEPDYVVSDLESIVKEDLIKKLLNE